MFSIFSGIPDLDRSKQHKQKQTVQILEHLEQETHAFLLGFVNKNVLNSKESEINLAISLSMSDMI